MYFLLPGAKLDFLRLTKGEMRRKAKDFCSMKEIKGTKLSLQPKYLYKLKCMCTNVQQLRFQKRKEQSSLELEAVQSPRKTLYSVHFHKSTNLFVPGSTPS